MDAGADAAGAVARVGVPSFDRELAMKHFPAGLVGAVVCLGLSAAPAVAQATDGVSQLKWMAGCWELRAGARVVHEQWMAPLGGMMLGISRTVVRDTVREFEQLRVENRAGQATYVARPSGQAETAFTATTVTDTLVMFSNPAHDFPQRIIYRMRGADSLVARIEGDQGGQVRGMNFPMQRVSCVK